MEGLENVFLLLKGFAILVLSFVLIVYIILGVVLTKLNKKIYGKATILAWLPFFNIYLLGKLTIGRLMGFVLVFFSLLGTRYEFSNDGNTVIYVIIPDFLRPYYLVFTALIIISLFICAIVKLNKLSKGEENYINEVYLNQKTKKEIEEEDEAISIVKWDDDSTSVNQASLTKEQNNDTITKNLPIEEEFNDQINNISVNFTMNQVEEKPIETPIISNESSNLSPYSDEPYDYDNPKIQEAIDNIIYNNNKEDIENM